MLKTLLESSAKKERNQAVTAASATVHGVLIIIAAFATAAGAPAVTQEEEPTTIVWTTTPAVQPQSSPAASTSPTTPPQITAPRPVAISVNIPSVIPAVNLTLAPITGSDFQQPPEVVNASPDTSNTSGSGGNRRAYTSNEVEVPVTALRGVQPEYPAALRSAGIQGEVVALFVVDESGRGVVESVRIVSATNDLFGTSVRGAIPRMRFKSARIGSQTVPQLVQQLFVFRLDR